MLWSLFSISFWKNLGVHRVKQCPHGTWGSHLQKGQEVSTSLGAKPEKRGLPLLFISHPQTKFNLSCTVRPW